MVSGQKTKLSPYQRIVRASKRGTGVRLSADDVDAMMYDTAITQLSANDDEATAAAPAPAEEGVFDGMMREVPAPPEGD